MGKSINKKYLLSILVLLVSFFIVSGGASAADIEMKVGEYLYVTDIAGMYGSCSITSGNSVSMSGDNLQIIGNHSGTSTIKCTTSGSSITKTINVKENTNNNTTTNNNNNNNNNIDYSYGSIRQGETKILNVGKKVLDCSVIEGNGSCKKPFPYASIAPLTTLFQIKVTASKDAPVGSAIKVKVHVGATIWSEDYVIYTLNVISDSTNENNVTISSQKLGETINLQVGGTAKKIELENLGSSISESKIVNGSEGSDNSNVASIACTSANCTVVAQSVGNTQVYLTQRFDDGSTIKWYFPVNVSVASNNNGNNSNTSTIRFSNLEGSTLDTGGFLNCSDGAKVKSCNYEIKKRYVLPSPSDNSKYGKFLGWSRSTDSFKYCNTSNKNFETYLIGDGSIVNLYAIYENTCSKSGAGATPIESTRKPGSTPITGPSAPSNAMNNINWAEALESGDCRYYQVDITHNNYRTYSYTYNGATHTGPVNLYSATEMCNNKNEYYSFCYDPDKAYHSAYNPYEFDNYINPFDGINVFPSAAGDSSIKQEAFIYYIYKKYGSQLDDTNIRAGIVIAIRAYQQMMDGSSSSNGKSAAFWQLANSWECEAGSSMCKPASTVVTNLNFGDIAGTAKSIYLDAKTVADTCTSSGCSGLEEIGVKWSQMESVECDTEGGTLTKKIQGSIAGLENYNGEYTYLEPICPSGLTCELRINNGVVSPGSKIPNGTKYEIWVKGSSDAFSKASGDVGIRVRALSKDDYHNVILLKSVNNSGSSQRFVTFLKNDQKQEMDIVVADISNVTCGACGPGGDPMLDPTNPAFNEEMYKAKCCDEPDALPEYCPQKDDVCVQAKWNLVCGADGDVYEIHEGVSQKTGKINYKDCIIDEKDPAENTYNIIKNRYCTISCKEDWEFQMPGDLGEHKAGTYMILAGSVGQHSLRVKGSRTCVAGNGTNTTTSENEILTNYNDGEGRFQRDLVNIDKQIVDAINKYSEAAAYVYWFDKQSTKTSETKNYSCGGGSEASCGGNPNSTASVSEHKGTATLNDKRVLNGTVRYRKIKFTPETSYDTNGKLGISEKNVEFEWGTASSKCKNGTTCGYIELKNDGDSCTSSCSAEVVEAKQDYGYDAWVSQRDSAKAEYNRLIAERQAMIDDITECNTWQNNFKYEPEISYTYQEQDYMNQLQGNNKFQIIGGGTLSVSAGETTYRDQESKRDDYKQMSGNGQESAYQQGNTNNIFTCALSDNDNSNGFISNCRDDHQKMYYSSSILLEKQAEYSYEIRGRWYTVHDSGAAIYNSSEELKTQLDDKTSLVTGDAKGGDGKVLPISENTQPGDYNYQLRFVDVGQYNGTPDNQALGRLIGGNDKSHSGKGSVFAALKGYKNVNTNGLLSGEFDQTYMCTYKVTNKNPCASKIKTEIISLLECPDGYRCSGYENDSGYIDVTGDVSFFVNNVSLNNLSPNRELAKNWQTDEGQKAKAEIESLGDGAYAQTPEYSFTVSPKGLLELKSQAEGINYGGFELACESDSVCTNPWLDTLKDIDGITVNNLRS